MCSYVWLLRKSLPLTRIVFHLRDRSTFQHWCPFESSTPPFLPERQGGSMRPSLSGARPYQHILPLGLGPWTHDPSMNFNLYLSIPPPDPFKKHDGGREQERDLTPWVFIKPKSTPPHGFSIKQILSTASLITAIVTVAQRFIMWFTGRCPSQKETWIISIRSPLCQLERTCVLDFSVSQTLWFLLYGQNGPFIYFCLLNRKNKLNFLLSKCRAVGLRMYSVVNNLLSTWRSCIQSSGPRKREGGKEREGEH